MRSMRGSYLAAAGIALALLASCHVDDDEGEGPAELRLPMHFELNATASTTEGEFTVDCSLGFVVEISGEVSRTNEVVEYIAVMGGEAVRNILRDDGSGVVLSAFAHYPNLQVLHIRAALLRRRAGGGRHHQRRVALRPARRRAGRHQRRQHLRRRDLDYHRDPDSAEMTTATRPSS
jgi:hypothetical protein